ncbi:MAG: phosphate transporter family protein [Gammaproteobacteria bacterium]|jgi:PiT family inorganic phosphate transporter|nr:phosphate transporter family protein [Gammaproteobacteria bacterium]
MANTSAIDPAAVAIDKPASSRLVTHKPSPWFNVLAIVVVIFGIIYAGYHLADDLSVVHDTRAYPFILLGLALVIALGFEFVNGFHDTANAVATVIYTNSMSPNLAVVWSGTFNFLGVLVSTGAVAFSIVSLLPVELILQVSSGAGFAMVFALLIAAILWNLGTWYFGLPSSSSHTLIGSIIGVGLMNQLMAASGSGTSGVDWGQATKIGQTLLVSPLIGFSGAYLLLSILKATIKIPSLYKEPEGNKPPPAWIRGLLILTCTGVSFFHGGNDGQKGMGLIMLILIGTVPTAYALNRTMHEQDVNTFLAASAQARTALSHYAVGVAPADPHAGALELVRNRKATPEGIASIAALTGKVAGEVGQYHSLDKVPAESMVNIRNDMYLVSEGLRFMSKAKSLNVSADDKKSLDAYKKQLDHSTKFIPTWVKVAVAIALGLGTMIGWKRIVVTVGERIGKTHLTYAQGASAELVAMATIGAAELYGLPVSTTHVLSSGVAGTMVANGSGLQWATVRNLLMAWILTLPISIALAGGLYWLLRTFL